MNECLSRTRERLIMILKYLWEFRESFNAENNTKIDTSIFPSKRVKIETICINENKSVYLGRS